MLEVVYVKGEPRMAMIVPEVCDRARARDLRNALLDMLDVCLASEDGKDAVSSISLFWVMRLIRELMTDLEKD